ANGGLQRYRAAVHLPDGEISVIEWQEIPLMQSATILLEGFVRAALEKHHAIRFAHRDHFANDADRIISVIQGVAAVDEVKQAEAKRGQTLAFALQCCVMRRKAEFLKHAIINVRQWVDGNDFSLWRGADRSNRCDWPGTN